MSMDYEKLQKAIGYTLECHLPENMKPLNQQRGERWGCQCGASGATTKAEYLEHVSLVIAAVVQRETRSL
jgi:hypothetical protein